MGCKTQAGEPQRPATTSLIASDLCPPQLSLLTGRGGVPPAPLATHLQGTVPALSPCLAPDLRPSGIAHRSHLEAQTCRCTKGKS